MKLLIITQKVDINDDVLGFFHNWLEKFAHRVDLLNVICLQMGKYSLPSNSIVWSLGKEAGRTRLKYIYRFYKYIWRLRKEYDAVFVHMNPEYVLLGGLFWRLLGKKVGLWYAHGYAGPGLKIAEKLTNIIFTSTKSGCRLDSQKIRIVGQGINVDLFVPDYRIIQQKDTFKIVTIGRISPVKDYETLIDAIGDLTKGDIKLHVNIIGDVVFCKHEEYFLRMKKLVAEKGLSGIIHFLGPIANKDIVYYLQSADLFVNMSHTGSLDKAILEAMASGLPILTCNEALVEVLGKYKDVLMYTRKDARGLADKIKLIMSLDSSKRKEVSHDLRDIVVKNHRLENLVEKILNGMMDI